MQSVNLSDCIQLLQSNHQIAGIVLNPMSDNVVLPSALFHGQNTTEKQVSFGISSKDYSWLTTPLILFLQQNTDVRTVYLLMVVRGNQPVATLVKFSLKKEYLFRLEMSKERMSGGVQEGALTQEICQKES